MSPYHYRLARALKRERQKLGLSIPQLSEATGIHRSVLYSYEAARIQTPDKGKLKILAKYFGVEEL